MLHVYFNSMCFGKSEEEAKERKAGRKEASATAEEDFYLQAAGLSPSLHSAASLAMALYSVCGACCSSL